LRAILFGEKNCFRFGMKIQSALPCVFHKSLPD
jgi:hypothetical protein